MKTKLTRKQLINMNKELGYENAKLRLSLMSMPMAKLAYEFLSIINKSLNKKKNESENNIRQQN